MDGRCLLHLPLQGKYTRGIRIGDGPFVIGSHQERWCIVETARPTASAEERQRRLLEISRRYMRGEMDLESFAVAEQHYRPNYRLAVRALAKRPPHQERG